jgi:predicted DCC family thiol-disulfide oxidoreductase YuxK
MTVRSAPVLLYDGTCGFCAGSVRFVLRHDRRGTVRFAALQSPFGQRVLERHPQLRRVDSMVWLDESGGSSTDPHGERVSVRSDAALRVAHYLGGWWSVARIARFVPRPIRDAAYDLVARHRHRLSREACLVLNGEERRRFLED